MHVCCVIFNKVSVSVSVYEGHRVKVKVTGAEDVQIVYSRNVNFDRPYSGSVKDRAIRFACSIVFRQRRIEWCDRPFCHVTGSDHA